MSDSSDDIPEPCKGKRRANPTNYKRNVIKRARVMGKQYENNAGNVVPAKSLIDVVDVKRRRPRDDPGKEGRQYPFKYHIMVGSERREVR
ncbi:hypothetical protein PR048_006532 [Dryococelus australis]|uniref:Uncharacterized protein n=1 Tax=Dryococelus australis TaxID=614101 RepID=A0ABQ9IC79_9NEOP|nr:hypothetical protein PR048_006532 [Dryococelus australis]